MDNSKTILAKNIRYLMEQKQKTRTELCEALGVKYTTLSDWVNGKTYPRIDKIELMANMMGLGVLFSGFIEMAINHSEELIKKFRLKRNVTCACMLIGYPDISYKRTALRKNINVEWL